MKRNEWTFAYPVPILFAATQAKRKHHEERATFWRAERETAEAALREKGLEIRAMPVSGGYRNDVMLDPQLSGRVSECEMKLREHEGKREEYMRWERTFAAATLEALELHADDIAFFGVADGTVAVASGPVA